MQLKRYSVDLDGRIVAAFDDEEAARFWLDSHWWLSVATIYDHELHKIILTEVRI